MIPFFRKIRKKMADDNKPLKYMRYAIGEIALIMVGIFMALQLNNWNENRKQEVQFKVTLKQLYSTIFYDAENLMNEFTSSILQAQRIDSLLEFPDLISDIRLPLMLHSLTNWYINYNTETSYHFQRMSTNPENSFQNEISKMIAQYISASNIKFESPENRLKKLLNDLNIAYPKAQGMNNSNVWKSQDSTYYNSEDILRLRNILKTKEMQTILKNDYSYFMARAMRGYGINTTAESILKTIKSYYPEVKLVYKDVGIIGSAIEGWDSDGFISTPLILTDAEKNIWELDLYMKKGAFKFRCKNSWAQNWGGDSFPKGKAKNSGADIKINESGNYHVVLNLTESTYEFIKIKDE